MTTTAFVLSGGGSLGALQVGMLQALAAHRIRPDVIVGTSVGAINGAHLAGDATLTGAEALADVWRSLRTADVFPLRPLASLTGLLGRRTAVSSSGPLRQLLERHVRFEQLEDAPIPLHMIGADLMTGAEVRLSSGPAVDAALASAAIPGILPPVEIAGRWVVDGGVANHTPVSVALSLGAERVYVLATSHQCHLLEPPRGAVQAAAHVYGLLTQRQLTRALADVPGHFDVRVPPPPCPTNVSPADFSRVGELIDRSREATAEWLRESPTRVPA